jgi:hypothetical protein
VVAGDLGGGFAGGKGAGGAEEGEFAPHAVGAEGDAEGGAVLQDGAGVWTLGRAARACRMRRAGGFLRAPGGGEGDGVGLIGVAAADHLDAGGDVAGGADFDGEAEAVEELGAQVAFLGVAGADEDEAGGVADRKAVAFDDVLAGLGDVEEEVDDVVLQQVDLVDVEIAAVGAGEEAGLERLFAARRWRVRRRGRR